MKRTIIISVAFYMLLAGSCKNKRTPENNNPETPVALQEESSSILSKKRGSGDLVESLYAELVEKTPELKDLESQIGEFDNRSPDSLEAFERYDGKNSLYYNSAKYHYELIQDSVLKERIRSVIANSQASYASRISNDTLLISQFKNKKIHLNDLHIILKLSRTLPLIEKFQTDNRPSPEPVKSVLRVLEELIRKTDSLSKK
jgi:hypothetical protein